MLNNKGFSFIEIFIATSLIIIVAATFIPINSQLENERLILKNRLNQAYSLQYRLQSQILREPAYISDESLQEDTVFSFKKEDQYLKGCVEWINVKQVEEKICSFGIIEE